jgi:polysaccharide export outer membrane protein
MHDLMAQYEPRRTCGRLTAALLLLLAACGAQAQGLPDYHLQPGDVLEVSVWGEEDLQREVLVRPDGKFSFPLLGEFNAYERTTSELQEEMRERLVQYIPEAVVTVAVSNIEGNAIYVIGEVENPGKFVMNPRLTVLQALSLARGTTPFAAVDNIIVVRGSGPERQVFNFRYSDVSRGRNLQQDIELQSGDVVIVPE